ncbi:hypothetical protein Tco_0587103, partial [Tanacetum coccineum]
LGSHLPNPRYVVRVLQCALVRWGLRNLVEVEVVEEALLLSLLLLQL